MASTKQINCNAQPKQNNSCGKRKKSKGNKGSYLSKWLDKSLYDAGSVPSLDTDMYVNPNVNWHIGNSQFGPGYDSCRHDMYGYVPTSGLMSLPTLPTHNNPVGPPADYHYMLNDNKNIQVQRSRLQPRSQRKVEEIVNASNDISAQSHYFQSKNFSDSQDYTSLPPIITSVVDTNSVSDVQTNDKDDGSNTRRFSDPCVRGLPDVARPANGEVDSTSESDSVLSGSQVGGRLLSYLLDQISSLKMVNARLNKELIEAKGELETLRQQQSFFPQAQTNYSSGGVLGGQYSPGVLTDLVREIRDAARLREEAMYTTVRAMVHERTDSGLVSNETKMSDRALEEIKSMLRASDSDKRRMMERIGKLEEELRGLRVTNGLEHNESRLNGNVDDADSERMRLRKELADARRATKNAEENAHKLERLVTQMRSKIGLQITNGPDSLPSDQEHEPARIRRISSSTNNSTNNLSSSSTHVLNNSTHNITVTPSSNYTHTLNNSTASTMVFGLVTDL